MADPPPAKQQKLAPKEKDVAGTNADAAAAAGTNVIIQFHSSEGEPTGPQLDLPHDVTPQQLETLLNGLLQQEERMPYSFFVEEQELGT